jgi:hypothetical protein
MITNFKNNIMKRCTKCNIEKELTEFYKHKDGKDGFHTQCKSCAKEYIKQNKEKVKEYYQQNKERIKEYKKKWHQQNKEIVNKRAKEWNKQNNKRRNERERERKKTDTLYKMKVNLRTRTSYAFKNKGYPKNSKTQEMLGVDWEVCKAHIEKQFKKGMNWDNQGEWHIDHIIPLASANTEQELKKLCHYSNLQPLCAEENLSKNDSINGQQVKFRI